MERRRKQRTVVDRKVIGRVSATPIEVKLLDLSVSGCKAQSSSIRVALGATILLNFPDAETVIGEIVWHEADIFGISFDHEISAESLMRFICNGLEETRVEAFVRDQFGRRLPKLGSPAKRNRV